MRIEQSLGQQPLLQALSQQLAQLRDEAAGIQPNSMGGTSLGGEGGSFMQAMRDAVHNIDADQHRASALMAAVEVGRSDDLVGAMVASQKAGLSFSALVQVRNKLVSGFDDIMRMPL